MRDVFDAPENHACRTEIQPGTLVLFNGKYALHRVSPVGPTDRPRIIAIFSYDKRPDKLFSRDYIDMVRNFRQDAVAGINGKVDPWTIWSLTSSPFPTWRGRMFST